MRQTIFAFQSRPEDDRFFIPTNSYLYMIFARKSDTVQENGGCIVTHEELKRTLNHEITEYIFLRAKQQHNACRRRLVFDPCMTMVTRGVCSKLDCGFQHIPPEKTLATWFNTRIRNVLMEIQILNLAGFHYKGIFTCVVPLTTTAPDSDFVRIEIGSVSYTLFYTPPHQSSALSPYSISVIRRNQRKGSRFCGNGSGGHAVNSCSAPKLRRSTTSKPSSPTSCLFAQWHTTSTSSGHKSTSLVHGCSDTISGPRASLGQD
jgi:hypothetical protein